MSPPLDVDVVVVGAGPAGLSAALAAASAGASVVVLDEYPDPGGQFYRQRPAELLATEGAAIDADADAVGGAALIGQVRAAGVTVWTHTIVWGSYERGSLAVMRDGASATVRGRVIIIATGATERPGVFPGWDLPGVMTPGGAQALVKGQGVLPGRRIVLAGSGPFLLPVARTLIKAGVPPVALYEATHPVEWVKHAGRLWGQGSRIVEALAYRRALVAAGVPLRFRQMVVRAEGAGVLERVVAMQCDAAGRPVPGTEREERADVLCVGYGFVPAVQLTRLLGCRHRYDRRAGGWIPEHDADMLTSVPGVFVAGEVAGIGGAQVAMAEGALAARAAARQIGLPVSDEDLKRDRTARAHHRAFARLVGDVFALKAGVWDPITDDTIVCRCEEVTAGEIRAACRPWGCDVNAIKGATRCGMGYCQGRICGSVVEDLVAGALGMAPGTVGHFHVRAPLKPLRVSDLAADGDA